MVIEEIITNSRSETESFAEELAKKTHKGAVLALNGDLGAGKTCFACGFAKGMGYDGDVCSPTFAIVNEYRGGRLDIYHFDMYRVLGWEDLYTTGYFEALESRDEHLKEWREKIAPALPEQHIPATINKLGDSRRTTTHKT